MARTPFTLAATVTSALPRVGVVGAGALTEGATGRYDSAVVQLDDGRQVVVRVPADPGAARELAAEARALRALTPGVRAILPFRAPELLGETGFDGEQAVVVDYVPGYRIDAGHVPAGRGAATSLGVALAALHALPPSVLRAEGLPAQSADQLRAELRRLLDRSAATHKVPPLLLDRWRRAIDADALWRFESTVVLGGVSADGFLFTDDDTVGPRVSGLLDWHGLSLGDPAIDLRWLASAPAATEDVYDAYVDAAHRAPDAGLRVRARLYAELEFAKWLLHGVDEDRGDIESDAIALLVSLADGVRNDDLAGGAAMGLDVDDAIALLSTLPSAQAGDVDTSMQTDAYDPGVLSMFVGEEDEDEPGHAAEAHLDEPAPEPAAAYDDDSTAPIELPRQTG